MGACTSTHGTSEEAFPEFATVAHGAVEVYLLELGRGSGAERGLLTWGEGVKRSPRERLEDRHRCGTIRTSLKSVTQFSRSEISFSSVGSHMGGEWREKRTRRGRADVDGE